MYKVGIDLSTTNTGVVVLNKNNKLIYKTTFSFLEYKESNFKQNIKIIYENVKNILVHCGNEVMVGIEIANFRNAKLTNKFNLYAGALIATFFLVKNNNYIFKTFNSNQWQRLIGCPNKAPRKITKAYAKQFVLNINSNYQDWTQDEYDAYCIAYFLQQLDTTFELHKKVIAKKRESTKQKLLELKKQKQINNRLQKITNLDKIKNKKLISRLENEIKELSTK